MFQNWLHALGALLIPQGGQRHNSLPFLHRDLAYETRTWPNGCLEVLFVYIVAVFYFNYLPLTAKVFFCFSILLEHILVTRTYNIYTNVNG